MSRVPVPESDAAALESQALLSRLPVPGTIIAEKYRIAEVLGSGAMGCVMAAEHLLMQRKVAVKFVLGRASSPNAIQRFFREARVTQSLQDEHVVRVYDLGVLENGTPYLVMEYLEGRDLGQILKTQGKLPAEDAADYVLAACQALAEAHASGVVHRDIKPSNLLLTLRRNGTPLLKVVDFGISKLLDDDEDLDASLTGSMSLLGSPLYMSPEQVRSAKAIDERCDVWALGVTLYALLTGRAPFQGDGVHGVCAAIVADPPAPFSATDDVHDALQAVVMACLIKRPEERTDSVTALAAQLAPFASKAGQLNAARIEALYAEPPEKRASAWQPQLAAEITADAVSGRSAASGDLASGDLVSGEAATAIATEGPPAADGGSTLNQGTAQTLSPERSPRAQASRRRATLALGVASVVLAAGFGARQLLAPTHDAGLSSAAASPSSPSGGTVTPSAPASINPAEISDQQAEVGRQRQPAAAPLDVPKPSTLVAGTPRTSGAAKPSAAAPLVSSQAPETRKPKAPATDDDGFVIPD